MGLCNTCHRPKNNKTHVKIFQNWVCDMAVLTNGHTVHVSRVPELVGKYENGQKVKVHHFWIERDPKERSWLRSKNS